MHDGDIVVIIIVVGALAIGLISMLVGWLVARYDSLRAWWSGELGEISEEVYEPEPEHSMDMNAVEPVRTDGSGSAELILNGAEIEAIARMIKHNATAIKPSKSSTIAAGFGVSRGGSAAYIRASGIYDALFGRPEPAIVTPIAGRSTHADFASERRK